MRMFGKNKVDEREEKEMYQIEHYMYWFAFWGLLISILAQQIFFQASFRQIAGEWVVFMLMAVGTVIGELRGGHYDYITRPGWKSYLAYSLAGAAACALLAWLNCRMRGYDVGWLPFIFTGISAFVLLYPILAVVGAVTRRRRKKLEEEFDEE